MAQHTDRRGFLKSGIDLLGGALALSVLPGLAAADELIGQKLLWTPDKTIKAAPVPVVLPPANDGSCIQVLVRRLGSTDDMMNFVMHPLGMFRWYVAPGDEIRSSNGHLQEIIVSCGVVVGKRTSARTSGPVPVAHTKCVPPASMPPQISVNCDPPPRRA